MRSQPPAYSPLPWRAFISAFGAGGRSALVAWLRSAYGAEGVYLLGSGTQALHAGMQAAMATGREPLVALPAFTCPEVASAAIGAGARILLYDVDPATLGPDLQSVERALIEGAAIIVAAPLCGVPVDWEELQALADRRDAVLIEDAAQGHGGSWRGRRLGSLGQLSVLSFGRGKGWTGGSGGALLYRGSELSPPSVPLAGPSAGRGGWSLARAAVQAVLARPALYRLPRALPFLGLGETEYHAPRSPEAMADIAAGLVLATSAAAEAEAQIRREHAAELLANLPPGHAAGVIHVGTDAIPGYLRLPLRVSGGVHSLADPAGAQHLGIAPSYLRTLNEWPEVRPHLLNREPVLPGARELAAQLITLPTHSRVRPKERRRILELLRLTRR